MKNLSIKVTISKGMLKRLGYEKTPKKKEMRRTITNSLYIFAGLKEGIWTIT